MHTCAYVPIQTHTNMYIRDKHTYTQTITNIHTHLSHKFFSSLNFPTFESKNSTISRLQWGECKSGFYLHHLTIYLFLSARNQTSVSHLLNRLPKINYAASSTPNTAHWDISPLPLPLTGTGDFIILPVEPQSILCLHSHSGHHSLKGTCGTFSLSNYTGMCN